MKCSECLPMDEVFTHIDEDGAVRHINASALMRDAEDALNYGVADVIELPMEGEFVQFIRDSRGVEEHRLARLCEPYLSMPCLGIEFPDGGVLTVDGHHRIVKWHALGHTTYRMVLYHGSQLPKYCIDDFPEDFSEIIAEATKEQLTEAQTIQRFLH